MNKVKSQEGDFSGLAFGAVSIIIIGFLGLQVLASFWDFNRFWTHYWPFTNYPMYSGAKYEGAHITARTLVFGRQENGTEVEIVPEDLNLGFYKFEKNFASQIRPKIASSKRQTLKVYLEIYERRHGKRFTEIRSMNGPMVLGREGAIPAPSETLILRVSDLYGED